METSRASTLKHWIQTSLGGNRLGIQCPHCGGKVVVNGRMWLKPRKFDNKDDGVTTIIGRACTYCFKTSRID